MAENSFDARGELHVGDRAYEIFRLDALQQRFDVARLPFSLKLLLENLLRTEGNGSVEAGDVEALASWDAKASPSREIAFSPARVLMQDFTGVPAVVDLAAMRDAIAAMGGDPARINPLVPAELRRSALGMITTNSSPPYRATRSNARNSPTSASTTSRSTASPAW